MGKTEKPERSCSASPTTRRMTSPTLEVSRWRTNFWTLSDMRLDHARLGFRGAARHHQRQLVQGVDLRVCELVEIGSLEHDRARHGCGQD